MHEENNLNNNVFVTPSIPIDDLTKSIDDRSPFLKINRKKKRKTANDKENVSHSDIEYNSDVSGSQSTQSRITKLQTKIGILEDNNKSQADLIISLKMLVEKLEKRITDLETKNNNNTNNSTEMKDDDNLETINSKPLFCNLFKSKESDNMNFEIKNILNVQQDAIEREKKKNNIIVY